MKATSEQVKSIVDMPSVLQAFGIRCDRQRIPCPIHLGKDNNFRWKEKSWTCFVCGQSGSVIDFVMQMNHCDFKTALDWLCEQFGIENSNESTPAERAEAARMHSERLQARFQRDKAIERGMYTHGRLCAYLRYLMAQSESDESGMIGYIECILDEYSDRDGMERLGKVLPDVDGWIKDWRQHWAGWLALGKVLVDK